MSNQRAFLALVVAVGMFSFGGCTTTKKESVYQRHEDANTVAGKMGKAAHAVAVETGKAASVAGRKIEKAAHQAHEGWEEAAQNDRDRNRK